MDPMQEAVSIGTREHQEQQRDMVRELLDSYCSKFGGSREQFYEAAGINSGRFSSYVEGTGLSDITAEELSSFMSLASKLEKARR
jgi:hypothetical protein